MGWLQVGGWFVGAAAEGWQQVGGKDKGVRKDKGLPRQQSPRPHGACLPRKALPLSLLLLLQPLLLVLLLLQLLLLSPPLPLPSRLSAAQTATEP